MCLPNTLLRVPALTEVDEANARRVAQQDKSKKVHGGYGQHAADWPVYRIPGPLWKLVGLNGDFVDASDKRHPMGPGRRKSAL